MTKLVKFSELEPLGCESKWFQVYSVLPGITAIFEPYHFQEVISYLIEGSEKAMLFDSGMDVGNIKAVVDRLTDKPVIVCNSHSHFDHTGGNYLFGETHLLNIPECVKKLEEGYYMPMDSSNRLDSSLHFEGKLWFDLKDPELFHVKPSKVHPVEEGFVFDLGDRKLRVIATPGHSKDGLMLADDENKLLFTGDTVYPAPIYAFMEGPDMVPVYAATAKRLAEEFSTYTLCCAHNNPVWDGQALVEISQSFEGILAGTLTGRPDGVHTSYDFENFSILV